MLAPGAQLGKYRLEHVLGTGGMGAVWAAHDVDLDRKVALKVLGEGLAGDATAQARLLREARAMARLRHPNVVPVYDALTLDGHDVIVMELVDGMTLAAWLAAARRSFEDIMPKLLAAGRGLAAAHAAGMVHRDFKPHNVLVDGEGRVLVTDFGLARGADLASLSVASGAPAPSGAAAATADGGTVSMVRGDAATMAVTPSGAGATPHGAAATPRGSLEAQLTRTGTLLGTPAYMAPEQLRGESATARADQFAFAVTTWEALTGARPYSGPTIADIARAMDRGEPAEAASVPRQVRPALERALAKEPEARWPSMTALLAALERPARTRPSMARRFVAAGVGLALLGGVAVWRLAGKSSTDGLSRTCGAHTYRVSSGQHGMCNETVVTPGLFQIECKDTAGNRGALECAQGFSNCETHGTGTCGIAD